MPKEATTQWLLVGEYEFMSLVNGNRCARVYTEKNGTVHVCRIKSLGGDAT